MKLKDKFEDNCCYFSRNPKTSLPPLISRALTRYPAATIFSFLPIKDNKIIIRKSLNIQTISIYASQGFTMSQSEKGKKTSVKLPSVILKKFSFTMKIIVIIKKIQYFVIVNAGKIIFRNWWLSVCFKN